MLHGDIGVIVGDAEIVDAHDVRMIEAGDDLVFLNEAVEAHEPLGDVRHLAEHLEHHHRAGALALGQIDLAHAAGADLADAAVAANGERAELVQSGRSPGGSAAQPNDLFCSREAIVTARSSRSRSTFLPYRRCSRGVSGGTSGSTAAPGASCSSTSTRGAKSERDDKSEARISADSAGGAPTTITAS